uniref:Uncharacterized protein n=1 Tax=Oryza brachyantha TaxID=4533 RepID=J3MSI6_ORYBR
MDSGRSHCCIADGTAVYKSPGVHYSWQVTGECSGELVMIDDSAAGGGTDEITVASSQFEERNGELAMHAE